MLSTNKNLILCQGESTGQSPLLELALQSVGQTGKPRSNGSRFALRCRSPLSPFVAFGCALSSLEDKLTWARIGGRPYK